MGAAVAWKHGSKGGMRATAPPPKFCKSEPFKPGGLVLAHCIFYHWTCYHLVDYKFRPIARGLEGFKSPGRFPTNISNAGSLQTVHMLLIEVHQNTGFCTQNFKHFLGLITLVLGVGPIGRRAG